MLLLLTTSVIRYGVGTLAIGFSNFKDFLYEMKNKMNKTVVAGTNSTALLLL